MSYSSEHLPDEDIEASSLWRDARLRLQKNHLAVAGALALVIVILSNAITCCVMLGMACTVTVDALKKARHHLGFLGVGLASQWLLMPAVAYAVARAFDLAPPVPLTLLQPGC